MNATDSANVYKMQQVMTASPEDLTLMLYNGAIRFTNESIKSLEGNNLERAHIASLKAQDIVREFMCTLDMQYDISKQLYSLYDYIEYRLIQGNLRKDKQQLEEARNILSELRDTWAAAVKKARSERTVARQA